MAGAEAHSSQLVPYGPGRSPWRETLSEMAVDEEGQLLVSPPSGDPLLHSAPVPEGITPSFYQVPSSGLAREDHDRAMEETEKVVRFGSESICGAMGNRSCEIPGFFQSPYTSLVLNNAGDPFVVGASFSHQLKWMERNVLDYYASLWNAKWPHQASDSESYWGYVLTMGSTEGNLHALWSARNYLTGFCPAPTVQNTSASVCVTQSKVPVVFFSRNSNTSLYKCCDMINVPTFDAVGHSLYPNENPLGGEWTAGVPCIGGDVGPGAIDVDALEMLVDFFSSRCHPVIIIFNYGTTFKCACDDIKTAGERVVSILKKNNMYECVVVGDGDPLNQSVRQGFWFHVDGAIAASYMPFLEMAYRKKLTNIQPASVFDFRLDFITSIVTSGHKYLGLPWPTGVYIIRNSKKARGWNLPYLCSYDSTISLSRNGHSVALFWSYISRNSFETQVSTILRCLGVAEYAVFQLHKLQEKIGLDLWITHTPPSLAVAFRRPNASILSRHTLFTSTVNVGGGNRHFAQVYAVPHLTRERVDSLIKQLEMSGAFDPNES